MNNFYNNPYGPNYMGPTYGANNYQSQRAQVQQYAFVNGIKDAKEYQVYPGSTMLLMDSNAPICYMKGPNGLQYYKLEQIDEATAGAIINPPAPQPNYASKEDIDILNKKMDELFKRLDASKPKKEQNNA